MTRPNGPESSPGAVLTALFSVAVFGLALFGLLRGADPWATWFYPLAWYPTLVLAELWLRRRGRPVLSRRPRLTLALFAWSVPFWLLFELINFRVANWYYVFVPPGAVERWSGVVLSFATVIPLVFVSQAVASELGVGRSREWPRLRVSPRLPLGLQLAGVVFVVLSLGWPLYLFPLVWGAVTLLLDPWVYARDPDRSLLGALERGRPAVILQLLAGGLAIGFLWELYNVAARGKWIYTVPGLEEVKLFEMPVLGFLGFPVLALDAWAAWNALVLAGLAPRGAFDPGEATPGDASSVGSPRPMLAVVTLLATTFSAGVLLGMQRFTISSVRPELPDVAGAAAPALGLAGYDAFSLARAEPGALAASTGASPHEVETWIAIARLATLRGIGAEHARRLRAAGVPTVEVLATQDAADLAGRLGTDRRHERARVRVWVRAARRAVDTPRP